VYIKKIKKEEVQGPVQGPNQLPQKDDEEEYRYFEEDEFYSIKSSQNNKSSSSSEIEVILKVPLLSADKKHKIGITKDNYEIKKVDYYNSGRLIYPSEKETEFSWEVGNALSTSDLPLRLCYISDEVFKFFSFKRYFEENYVESISLEGEKLSIKYYGEEKKELVNFDEKSQLKEIKDCLQQESKDNILTLDRQKLDIEIKKRVECDDNVKHYAILSYS